MRLLNAFSASMLPLSGAAVAFRPIEAEDAAALAAGGCESAVGHADTAALFAAALGCEVPVRRESVILALYETALLGQYVGPRLPEGTAVLPEGAAIRWLTVTVDRLEGGE